MAQIQVSRITSQKQQVYSLCMVVSFSIQFGYQYRLVLRSIFFHVIQGIAVIIGLVFFLWYTVQRSTGESMYLQDFDIQIGNRKLLPEDIVYVRIRKRNVWIRTTGKWNRWVIVRLREPDVTQVSVAIKEWTSAHGVSIR